MVLARASSIECELEPSSAVVALVGLSGLFGSACDETFDCVYREFAVLASVVGRSPVFAAGRPGAAAVLDGFGVCCLKGVGIDVDGWLGLGDEVLSRLAERLDGEVLVGAGEVEVDLEKGVVVGGLGVWAERTGTFAEQLYVDRKVVAFAVGGYGCGCGQP